MAIREVLKLAVCVLVCEAAGLMGSAFTTPAIPEWYAFLYKPWFTPPNWLFGPVWITLYFLMGIAAFLVWRLGLSDSRVRSALLVFVVQLVLNVLWSAVFFGLRSPLGGLVVIVLLLIAIIATIIKFWPVSKTAGWLLVPYLLWVGYASALTFAVWRLNP